MTPILFSPPLSWRSPIKRLGDLLVVYGHGLLAFGVSKAFVAQLDFAAALGIVLGLVCHISACYISFLMEA